MQNDEIECLEYVVDAISQNDNDALVFANIDDNRVLLKFLKEAKPNSNPKVFPDFISNNIIVEHFSITSSKENRKGSSFMVEQNMNNKETQKHIEEWKKSSMNKPFKGNTISSEVIENTYEDLSYKNFINSLTKNLEHHIDSLKKFALNNRKVIFLIELQDALMGIYRHNAFYKFYELYKDKNALDIFKLYLDLLDIIIFRASDRIEIINIKKFKELYRHSYCEEDIRGGRHRDINVLTKIDLFI